MTPESTGLQRAVENGISTIASMAIYGHLQILATIYGKPEFVDDFFSPIFTTYCYLKIKKVKVEFLLSFSGLWIINMSSMQVLILSFGDHNTYILSLV